MRIECDNCGAKYSIADEKVAGRMIRLRCKKCGHNIRVDGTSLATDASATSEVAPAMDGGGDWYVVIDGQQSGPLSTAEIQAFAQQGAVVAESLAWRDGMDDWQSVSDIPELASALGLVDSGEPHENEEEATRVVAPPSEQAPAPEPFSFAGRPSALSESFASAPAVAPRVAAEPAAVAVNNDAFFSAASKPKVEESAASMTGQRKDNSVLFSLSDLTSTRSATQKNEALPRTEGSGLIDIRVLAQSQAAVGGGAAAASAAGGPAAAPMATRQMVPIVPVPVRRSNTTLYAVLGVGGLIVVALLAVLIILLMKDDPAPVPVAPAVPEAAPAPTAAGPAEGSAAQAQAAAPAEPTPEAPAEGSVVAIPADPPAEASAQAAAEADAAAPAEAPTDSAAARPVAVAARTEARPAPAPAPARNEPAPERQEAAAPANEPAAPAERTPPAASARDVIANLNAGNSAAPAREEAAAPANDVPASLNRSEVQTTIRRYRSRIAACNGAGQTGTYRVSFRITSGGGTEAVSVDNSDAIGSCLADVVRGMTFPRNGGETPPVTYPFSF